MSEFELTEDEINLNIWISTGASAASLVLCAAVLGASAWIWRKPHLRPYIDRVSFRLLLWSMVFEVAYDVVYIAVELYSFYEIVGPACAAGVYFMMAFMGVVNYLCTAIAVNLMLTITFGLNPIKAGLEKWYVGISIALGMFVPIVPAGLGHFGFDPILQVCWITGRSDEQRMRYFILDLILSCFIASASVIATLTTLLRQRRATAAALFAGNQMNRAVFSKTSSDWSDVEADQGSRSDASRAGGRRFLWTRITGGPNTVRPDRIRHTLSQLEDRFLRIALKISSYPVALIVVNGIITVGDLYISKEGGVYSRSVYALYCVYYFLYGGRGIVFACLAFFVDPCLRLGLRAAWRERFSPSRSPPGLDLESTVLDTEEKSFSEMLAMPSPVIVGAEDVGGGGGGARGLGRRGSRSGEKDEAKAGRQASVYAALSHGNGKEGRLKGKAETESGSGSGSLASDSASALGSQLDKHADQPDNASLASTVPVGSRTITRQPSSASLDMPAALSHLAFERATNPRISISIAPPPAPSATPTAPRFAGRLVSPRLGFARALRSASSPPTSDTPRTGSPYTNEAAPRASMSPVSTPTRSFAGVDRESLPLEITDELDVVLGRQGSGAGPTATAMGPGSPLGRKPELRGILRDQQTSSGQDEHGEDDRRGRTARMGSFPLEPLAPDLPDAAEVERLRRRAWREQKRLEKEDAIRMFLETKAML